MRTAVGITLGLVILLGSGRATSQTTCTVPGLEHARSVAAWVPPNGCTLRAVGSPPAPRVVHDASELASVVTCTGAPPALDLRTHDLYVYTFSMSPAYAGGAVVDDGSVVTIVEHDRPPCAGDPHPMPMNATRAFILPKGAARTFQRASCTLARACP